MAFWKNVDNELLYRNVSRKELSFLSGVSLSVINKGMQRDSDVMAETAVRIADTINVPLEQLLDLPAKTKKQNGGLIDFSRSDALLYHKYRQCIQQLESLPADEKNAALQLISAMAKHQK